MPINRLYLPLVKKESGSDKRYKIEDDSIVVGTLKVTETTVSGFNNSSWLSLGADKRVEGTYYVHFKTPSSILSRRQDLIHAEGWLQLCINESGNLAMWNWTSTTWNNIITSVPVNMDYWLKIEISGNTRTIYVSMDGSSYGQVASFTDNSASTSSNNKFYIGQQSWTSTATEDLSWRGLLYLNDFKIVTGGGTEYTYPIVETSIVKKEYKIKDSAIIVGNNIKVTEDTVSGFNDSSWLSLGRKCRTNGTIYVHFRTQKVFAMEMYERILHAQDWLCLEIGRDDHGLVTYIWNDGDYNERYISIVDGSRIQPDTDYWVKIELQGGQRTFYFSTDGENYTEELSFYDYGVDVSYENEFYIGQQSFTDTVEFDASFKGSVYLNDFRIVTNNYRIGDSTSVVGSLTVGDNSVSGFSTSNYGVIPYKNSSIESMELHCKVKTSDDTSTRQVVYGQTGINMTTPQIEVNNGKLWLGISYDGTTWNVDKYMTSTISPNTWYVVDVTWDSVSSKAEYLVKDGNGTTVGSGDVSCTNVYWQLNMGLGIDHVQSAGSTTHTAPWLGTIALDDCYIKVNGDTVWQGETTNAYTFPIVEVDIPIHDYDVLRYQPKVNAGEKHTLTGYYIQSNKGDNVIPIKEVSKITTIVGSPSITENGEVSDFSDSNYLYFNTDLAVGGVSNFEMVMAFNLTSTYNGQAIYGSGYMKILLNSSDKLRLLVIDGRYTRVDLTGTTTIEHGVKYYVKIVYNSSSGYSMFTSTDGTEWTSEGQYTSWTSNPYQINGRIGHEYSSNGYYFRGKVYLDECYFIKQTIRMWSGMEVNNPSAVVYGQNLLMNETGEIKNFSSSDWLDFGKTSRVNGARTCSVHFKTPEVFSGNNETIVYADHYMYLFIDNNRNLIIRDWNRGYDVRIIENMEVNKEYWVKITVNDTTCSIEISENGTDYTVPTGKVTITPLAFAIQELTNRTVTGDIEGFLAGNGSITVTPTNSAYSGLCLKTTLGDWSAVKTIRYTATNQGTFNNYGYYDMNHTWHAYSEGCMSASSSGTRYTITCDLPEGDVEYIFISSNSQSACSYSDLEILDAGGNSLLGGGEPYDLTINFPMTDSSLRKYYNSFLVGKDSSGNSFSGTLYLKDFSFKKENSLINSNAVIPIYNVIKKRNFTSITGSLGVIGLSEVTGFSNSNYGSMTSAFTLPSSNISSFEIKVKLRFNSYTSYGRVIEVNSKNAYQGFWIDANTQYGIKLTWIYDSRGYTVGIVAIPASWFAIGKDYWAKWVSEDNGVTIKSYYSFNGEDYHEYTTYQPGSYKLGLNSFYYRMGMSSSYPTDSNYVFNGVIDLSETSVKVNDDWLFWGGMKETQLPLHDIRDYMAVIKLPGSGS